MGLTPERLQNLWHHPSLTNGVPQGNPTLTYGYNYTQANPGDLRVGASSGGSLKQDHMPYTLTRNTAGASPALTANRSYQATRDALHAIENKAGTTLVSSYTYSVNSIGQRDNVSTSGSAFAGVPANWSWLYDSLGQVRQADSPTAARDRAYEFDTIGNRQKFAHGTTTLPTNNNYTANALNQYSQVPSYTPQLVHDLDGNLTRGPVPGTNGNSAGYSAPADATELKWDAENRMISCKIGTITYYYGYDHLSRQIGRGETTALNRRYYYDGWNRIAEYTTLWTPHNTFTWGLDLSGTMQGAGGVGGLLVMRWVSDAGTPDYFPTYDGNGNVSEYLDTAGTNIVHYEYDPFGGLTRLTGNNSGRFQHRFSTKPRDFSTGLYYYGYRYYDPATGRWPSRDPIQERGGVNLYGFTRNDGINSCDILGLERVGCCLKNWSVTPGKPFQVVGYGSLDFTVNIEYKKKGEKETRFGEIICCDPAACLFTQWVQAKVDQLDANGNTIKTLPSHTNRHGTVLYPYQFVDDGYKNNNVWDIDKSDEKITYTDSPGMTATTIDVWNTRMDFIVEVVDSPTNEILLSHSFWINFRGDTQSIMAVASGKNKP